MPYMNRAWVAIAAAVSTAALLAGCSPSPSPAGTAASSVPTASSPITLNAWSWDPNLDKIVALWNKANPDTQIKLSNPAGGDKLVSQVQSAHQSGTAADIVKVEYQSLPSLVASGVAKDITQYVPDAAKQFTPTAFAQVNFEGKTYGVPQDFAPLVFFYREDLFKKYDITVPTTWDEYAAAARKLHKADPSKYLGTFSAADAGWFTGLAQQAGGNWWSASDNTWSVAINDPATKKVAEYWQGLISEGVIKGNPFWSPQWNKEMDNGTYAGWISGAWAPAQFPGIAPNTAGKWKMASLPAWTAGDATTGIWGGSAYIVTTDSKYPEQAAKFVNWLNTSDEALSLQISTINVFPSALSGQKLPGLSTPPVFMSNQPDYYAKVAEIAQHTRSFDIWGPDATVTIAGYQDGFAKAITNKTSFVDALDAMQTATVDDMTKKGFTVKQ
jgi:multiple sugar transport system substrate-binding protein